MSPVTGLARLSGHILWCVHMGNKISAWSTGISSSGILMEPVTFESIYRVQTCEFPISIKHGLWTVDSRLWTMDYGTVRTNGAQYMYKRDPNPLICMFVINLFVCTPAWGRPISCVPNSWGRKCCSKNFCFLRYQTYQYSNALLNLWQIDHLSQTENLPLEPTRLCMGYQISYTYGCYKFLNLL